MRDVTDALREMADGATLDVVTPAGTAVRVVKAGRDEFRVSGSPCGVGGHPLPTSYANSVRLLWQAGIERIPS